MSAPTRPSTRLTPPGGRQAPSGRLADPRAASPGRRQPVALRAVDATTLGWIALVEGIALASCPFWLPQPGAVALGFALILAFGLALVLSRWWIRGVAGAWVVPTAPHARDEATVSARLWATPGAPPVTLFACDPATGAWDSVAKLKPLGAEPVRALWSVRFPRRGRHELPPLRIRAELPFGLIRAARAVSPAQEVLVLPALGSMSKPLKARLRSWLETHASAQDAGDDELARLREYRPGDPPKRVQWRSSARAGRLLVAERHALGCRRLHLVLDTQVVGSGAGQRGLEKLIVAAATLIDELLRGSWSLTLSLLPGSLPTGADTPGVDDAPATGGIHLDGGRERLMEALALVQPGQGDVHGLIPRGKPALVLSLRPIDLSDLAPRPLLITSDEVEDLVAMPQGVLR